MLTKHQTKGEEKMSTRAVYDFVDPKSWGVKTLSIYKHHDGYPKGGVEFIYRAFLKNLGYDVRNYDELKVYKRGSYPTKTRVSRDQLAISFFTENQDSLIEFTTGADAHGDIEYRYEIERDSTIRIFKVESDMGSLLEFEGKLFEALERYCRDK